MSKGKVEFVDFKAIKQSVTMLQVLDRYGITASLKHSGDSLSGPCPLHGGDNPTHFRVSIPKNCFNCFGECKSGGNVLDFVAKREKVTIRQAALMLQQWFGTASRPTENVTPANAPIANKPLQPEPPRPKIEQPKVEVAANANEVPDTEAKTKNEPLGFALKNLDANHAYLRERGLAPETIVEFGLGYCAKGSMAGRIAIPIHDADGNVVAYAGRWPGTPNGDAPKYKQPKGFLKNLEVFNLHRAVKADPVQPLVVVEGFFGCMKIWQAGVRRVVAVMGRSISDRQMELIVQAAGKDGKVVLMFDADKVCSGRHVCQFRFRVCQRSGGASSTAH